MKYSIGEQARTLRLRRGLHQIEVAKLADVSRNCVAKLERDEGNTTTTTLRKVAQALGAELRIEFEDLQETNQSC